MSNQYRAQIDRYYLDTATIDKRIDNFGNKVMIIGSSAEAVTIYVEAKGSNLQGTGSLPLQNRDWLATPIGFEQLSLTWAAQPSAWIDILVLTVDPAPDKFEYIRQQRGTIESIASVVKSTDMTPSLIMGTVAVTTAPSVGFPANSNAKHRGVYNSHTSNTLFVSPEAGMVNAMPIPAGVFKTIPFSGDVYFKGSGNLTANTEEYA